MKQVGILTESKYPFEIQTIVAARLRHNAAIREEVRVPHRIINARGSTRRVYNVHEQSVRFFQPFFLQLWKLKARSSWIET